MQRRELHRTFQAHDLLYGLKAARDRNKSSLQQKVGKFTDTVIVDQYNARIICKFTGTDGDERYVPNPKVYEALAPQDKVYFDHLLHVPIKKIRITNNTVPTYNSKKIIKKLDMEQRKTRRACKAGLLLPNITIHFLLDGINAQELFNRKLSLSNQKNPDEFCHYDSYTSAELRFLFRHFDLTHNVIFYLENLEVNLFEWLTSQNVMPLFYEFILAKSARTSLPKLEERFGKISDYVDVAAIKTQTREKKRNAGSVDMLETLSPVKKSKLNESGETNTTFSRTVKRLDFDNILTSPTCPPTAQTAQKENQLKQDYQPTSPFVYPMKIS